MNYKKDFIKQIQTHVEQIIKTGKSVEMNTQSSFIRNQKKKLSKEADIGIKIQQLRTTVTNLANSDSYLSTERRNNFANHTSSNELAKNSLNKANQNLCNLQYSFEDLRSHSDLNYNQTEQNSQ